tara:strand:- start:33 stop:404 length:372 start_codon:yes stop_codon:yes gene_type:complete
MTKDELEVQISTLQNLVMQKNDELSQYAQQIDTLNKQLEDLDKPKLTSEQFIKLEQAIETGIGNYDFSDQDCYSIDFGLDYDGRVHCESLEFDNADDLAREVFSYVERLFGEADEDNNQLNQD